LSNQENASVIRTENRQPIRSQNYQETQEKMLPPSPGQHMTGAIQEYY